MKLDKNEVLQWTGTAFILVMYVVMNLFAEFHRFQVIMAFLGSACFFVWAYRVANKQQMIINAVAITVCLVGLFRTQG